MLPANQTIKAYKGDSFQQNFTLNRANFDFTGWTVRIQIRTTDLTTVLLLSTPILNILSLGVASITWSIPFATMQTLIPNTYFYDVQLTNAANTLRQTYVRGQFKVLADVTDFAP